jgi:hypothetical protein
LELPHLLGALGSEQVNADSARGPLIAHCQFWPQEKLAGWPRLHGWGRARLAVVLTLRKSGTTNVTHQRASAPAPPLLYSKWDQTKANSWPLR